MIRVNNIHLSLDYDDKSVRKAVAQQLRIEDVYKRQALHRVSEYIKMPRERLAAEVPRQAIKTARKLQERAVKVNTRPSLSGRKRRNQSRIRCRPEPDYRN